MRILAHRLRVLAHRLRVLATTTRLLPLPLQLKTTTLLRHCRIVLDSLARLCSTEPSETRLPVCSLKDALRHYLDIDTPPKQDDLLDFLLVAQMEEGEKEELSLLAYVSKLSHQFKGQSQEAAKCCGQLFLNSKLLRFKDSFSKSNHFMVFF